MVGDLPSQDPVLFVGRAKETARLAEMLSTHPVVAVHGAPGIGKTALVLHVAATAIGLPQAIRLSLGGVTLEREIVERLTRALGRAAGGGAGRDERLLLERLREHPRLLILDDVEEAAQPAVIALAKSLSPRLGASRLIIVSQSIPTGAEWPSFEVPPLSLEDGSRLLHALGEASDLTARQQTSGNPLQIRLFAAGGGVASVEDPMATLDRSIAELARGRGRELLMLLIAVDGPIPEHELVTRFGPGHGDVLAQLRQYPIAIFDNDAITLSPTMTARVRRCIGEPDEPTWREARRLAESLLAARPDSAEALMLACRLRVRLGDGAGALALLRSHLAARAAVSSTDLERMLRAVAAATPTCAVEGLLLLAREQLRWGDIQASERTLGAIRGDALEPSMANRFHALRAAALFRLGAASAANAELSIARRYSPPEEDVAVELATAELAIARGRLVPARNALLELGERTSKHPRLATRRAYAMGVSYYFEGRHPLAIAWAKRARIAAGRGRDPVLTLLEVVARLGCDQVDRASVIERSAEYGASDDEPFGRGIGVLMSGAILWRRGEFAKALAMAEPTIGMLGKRADQISRAVVSHYLARCAIGLGRFDQAEDLLRVFSGVASEPGIAILAPLCDLDHAALAAARGDIDEARRRVHLALDGSPRFPLARIEAWALSGAPALDMSGESEAAMAFATLRHAERALDHGELADAERLARDAERFYRRMDVRWELARSLLVIAEAEVRRPDRAAAATAAVLDCDAVASPMEYVPILVALALLRASLADRSGDLVEYAMQLAHAFSIATSQLRDRSLAAALARGGLVVAADAFTGAQPLGALVARLGLARSRVALLTEGSRAFLVGSDDPVPEIDLWLDVAAGAVRAGNATKKLSPIPLRILERIVSGGATGSTPEEIYLAAWAGGYHPLRHRNTLYVALNRLRATLKPLVGEDAIVEQGDGHYRLRAGLRVGSRHELAQDGSVRPDSFPAWQRAVAAANVSSS